jgi:hypothetical protein
MAPPRAKTRGADQGFESIGAKLETTKAPYDPFSETGNPNDPAWYTIQPGRNFMRPWLAIRNGAAFQWPLGLEGFTLTLDPTLGIHKYIGGNTVSVSVIHAGEEHFSMSGNFPGNSAPSLVAALRDVVYKGSPGEGKLLWLPEIVTYVQRVQVIHFEAARDQESRGRDMTYTIEFARMGVAALKFSPRPIAPTPQPTRTVKVDAKHNTLRKIAAWKLGRSDKWRTVYNANTKWFTSHHVPLAKIPDYRLPLGTTIHY